MYLRGREKERDRERERHMLPFAGSLPRCLSLPPQWSQSWEPGTQFRFLTWVAGTQILEPSPAASQHLH